MAATGKSVSSSGNRLFVTISGDAFARALAAGYLGSLRTGGATTPAHPDKPLRVLAFAEPVPSWAAQIEGDGAVVNLTVDPSSLTVEEISSGCFLIPGLLRTSRIQSAVFQTREDLADFEATYFQFPDVPARLVECSVASIAIRNVEQPKNLQEALEGFTGNQVDVDEIDAACGWAAVLVSQLLNGGLDTEIATSLASGRDIGEPKRSWQEAAQRALTAFDPRSVDVDKVVWGTIVESAMGHRSSRGFDRRLLLKEAWARLPASTGENPDVAKWFSFAREVLEARREPPMLDDHGSIGRRAALAILLAQDLPTIEAFGAGLRVGALAKLFIGAFQGLSRLGADLKNDRPRLAATQEGHPCLIEVSSRTFDDDLGSSDTVLLNAMPLLERRFNPSPHRIVLRARALEAGLRIAPEKATGRLRVYSQKKDAVKVYVEDDPASLKAHPVVRFWTPVRKMTARTPSAAVLRELLGAAWRSGCAIGASVVNDQTMLCAYAVVPTNTLDREEFDLHVASLERFVKEAVAL